MTGSGYLVSCGSCGTRNRVPVPREGSHGRCGRCSSPLPAVFAHPVPLTDRDFDSFLVENPLPVLAEFWAPW